MTRPQDSSPMKEWRCPRLDTCREASKLGEQHPDRVVEAGLAAQD
jgi:hypothetical protein